MFTLNLKVLFKTTIRCLRIATIVWIATSVTGTLLLAPTRVIELPFFQILALSLVFSTPSYLVVAPALAIQPGFPTPVSKLFYVISLALLACIAVIGFFLFVTRGFPLERELTISILTPYVIAALIVVPPSTHIALTSVEKNK